MEQVVTTIDVRREYFFLILEYGGSDFHYLKPRLFGMGVERFVFRVGAPIIKRFLSVLEKHLVSYDYADRDFAFNVVLSRKCVRFLDFGNSKEGLFRTEVHDIRLEDSKLREFTNEEKALIMKYRIEGGGQR